MFYFVVLIILIALLFDFLNGMNDAANAIATVVSTRVLSPKMAVVWAAVFNFTAVFVVGVSVANTIGRGIVDTAIVDNWFIFITLMSAVLWTYACTMMALPISVSHALIGGLMGTGIAKAGFGVLHWGNILYISLFIFLAPLLAMVLSYFIMVVTLWCIRRWSIRRIRRSFKGLQLVSSAAYSFSHGANDAQKTMGIIALLLFSNGYLGHTFFVPTWVIFMSYLTLAFGTFAGGWKVIRTMGARLTKLNRVGGFSAETAGCITILMASWGGIPVSTTHTIAGGIVGVGLTKDLGAVRWGVATHIVLAWVLTIPVACIMAFLLYKLGVVLGI